MSAIQNLRKSLVRNGEPVCSLVGGAVSGAEFAPFPSPLPPASGRGWAGLLPASSSLELLLLSFVLLSKTMGCFSGSLMSSASDQKLFCAVGSAFKCSLDEKVVSPSYSSAVLAPPLHTVLLITCVGITCRSC